MKFIALLFSCLMMLPVLAQEDCIDPELIDQDMICTGIFMPVCGCDKVTYQNDCHATYYGGVTSWTEGECQGGLDPCTDVAELDFGLCAMELGYALVYGQCTSLSGCGYLADGVDYSDAFYESLEECEACETNSDCEAPEQIDPLHDCGEIFAPVCGCDSVTYANACSAYHYGGISDWTLGECSAINPCTDVGDLDFGVCDFPLGVAVVNGVCTGISGCGYIVDGIDYSGAFYPSEEECLACGDTTACFNADQIDEGFACTEEYQPVCGCDNVTYSNSCYAFYYGGVTSWANGECAPVGSCTDVGAVDFGDCEMALGIAVVNGQCVPVSGCGYVVDGVDYSAAFHDFLQDCAYCQATNCVDVMVINQDMECPPDYFPVCGCDNVTYFNECHAYYYNGVTNWVAGECESVSVNEVEGEVTVQLLAGNTLLITSPHIINEVAVFDVSGKIVMDRNNNAPGEFRLSVSGVNPGIYIYRIRTKTGDISHGKIFIH